MELCGRLLLLGALLCGSWRCVLAASFYGESYVEIKVVESSLQTTLQLRFLTSKQDGLLFLAAGQEDYCLLELHSGRLQVKVNFGGGEQVLRSQERSHLNDLAWHMVQLHHEDENVTLTVDKNFKASGKIPGGLQELHFQHGLYVGGSSGLDVPYLQGPSASFRGCIEDVVFNQHEVLVPLRSHLGSKLVHEVSLGCSGEFFASEDDPISFFSSRSYIAFPLWSAQDEGVWEFSVQTTAVRGLLLYNSGRAGDILAMEIEDGLIKAYIGKGRSKTQLSSLSLVNDNRWHSVRLKFMPRHLQLTVDDETVQISLSSHSKVLHLKGPFFVGGIDDSTRVELIKLGLSSVSGKNIRGGSFKGCIKDMKANSVKKGLKDVLVTKDISPGCKTQKPLSTNKAVTTEKILVVKVAPTSAVSQSVISQWMNTSGHFLILTNLVLPEGGRASLESKHIKLNLEYKKIGIRQSQVVFKILEQPRHGYLRLEVEEGMEKNTFTMLDLWHGRVLYIHDGSENMCDHFTFSISTSSMKQMPPHLQGIEQHTFNITVTPINDAPELELPEGNLFVLLENTKKRLTTDLVAVTDIDTDSTGLSFSVLGNPNGDAGFLENSKEPGKAITTFSNSELKQGNIFYVHNSVRNSRIVLRASDGEKVSNTVVLRVMAVPLDYKVINTGLEVLQGHEELITSSNLSVQTNAVKQEVEIQYDITDPPKFGVIQRRHSGSEWKQVNSFSQRSLERDRVRYMGTFKEIQGENVTDFFKFKASFGSQNSEELEFQISVRWLKYKIVKNVPLVVEKLKKKPLNADHLLAVMEGIKLPTKELLFRLISLPKRGKILVNNNILNKNSTFSQKDVTDQKVEYELFDKPHENFQDSFNFSLTTKYIESKIYQFKINVKADLNSLILTNNGLSIIEGEGKLITRTELFVQTLNNRTFHYKVIESPRHGKLKLINFSDSLVSNDNIIVFSDQDLVGERLMYIHDDSETVHDEFLVLAYTKKSEKWVNSDTESELLSAEIRINISIELKNDEKPIRVVDKIFHVVKNGHRLLTLADLCYHDPDSDFDDGQLLYTRRGIPNGDLVLVNDTTNKLYQFRQQDLEQKRVLFLHHGADYGRFVLFVTDGKHYTSSLLEVSAADPYVKIVNNTGLLVQKGKGKILTPANFSVTTNQDIANDKDIKYNVFLPPKYGIIYVNNQTMDSFTHNDVVNGHVVYKHDDSNNLSDKFNFTVMVNNIQTDTGINVRMYLESHQHPPRVLHNSNLLVEEGKPVKISKGKLQVVHEDNSPLEIVFTIVTLPKYGYIRKFASEEGYINSEQKSISTFTQQDINSGNVQYVQTIPDQLQDCFIVDVSNGVQVVSRIETFVDIIPKLIPLEVQNITVLEGGSKALTEDYLKISNKHFMGLSCEFILLESPKHGCIENTRFLGVNLTKFTTKEVEQELIYYIHDDSEAPYDNFTILANNSELWKQSLPQLVFVTVVSINDEIPVITANNIFTVWVSSVTEVTAVDLHAEDKDSTPGELVFSITPPSNGFLALKSSPNKSILNFTQAHINEGQLLFIHKGAMSGGFNFQVTDGVNFAPRQIFSITARTLVITLEANRGLGVFPGKKKTISANDLKAVTNDKANAGNRTITFTVVSPPKLGKLKILGLDNTTQDTLTFTQSMVDQGLVIYDHTDSEATGWSADDHFTFTVSSPPAVLDPQVFFVTISYDINGPDQPSRLLVNTGSVVQEGEKVLIDKSKLDASNLLVKLPESQRFLYEVWYQVTSLPKHGMIVVGERNITKEKPNFSQYILDKFGITYLHDGLESLTDNFTFAVWPNLKSKSATRPDSGVVEEVFNITIFPVNDQIPEIKTKALHLQVLQGNMVALGPENLKVEDQDNTADEIKYTIISNPNNGYLATQNNLNMSIQHFTQADINSGKIWFIQDGSSASGVFYFSVTDGKHRPLYKLFNLEVTPILITLTNFTDLILQQGQSFITLNNTHLSATTNGKGAKISYNIIKSPKFGQLLIEREQVTEFEQRDLDLARLTYHMTDFSASHDIFEFTLFTSESNLTGQVMNIIVKPLMKVAKDLKIPTEILYKLKERDLDVMELSNLTNSSPSFEVTEPPVYGRLVKRSHHDATFNAISVFTQNDIARGLLLLDVNANMTGIDMLNDSFSFILKADNVQPAIGSFMYTIVPFDPLLIEDFTTSRPFSTSTVAIGNHITLQERPLVSTKDEINTTVPVQKWGKRNRWGSPDKVSLLTQEAATSSSQKETSTKGIIRTQANESSKYLSIVIALAVLASLFIVAIVSVCCFLMCRKVGQTKPPIKCQTHTAPNSTGLSKERSLPVPAIKVTLPRSTENCGVPPSVALRHDLLSASAAPAEKNKLHGSWANVEPEVVQRCQTINPALRHNQYWV
ncbi:chondroitin sulfate proteoglycan 4-like [Rhinatrema bivittatum]|uniref:chondroitin sulfate proteoglycan 4-like n=1 Tax=Rhinatrema bivittatum TaxID=194408 RepID=UPI00112AD306|nr:chondroitin sulfate proteoglycan 4-like [Rhinatrema bivittatum]